MRTKDTFTRLLIIQRGGRLSSIWLNHFFCFPDTIPPGKGEKYPSRPVSWSAVGIIRRWVEPGDSTQPTVTHARISCHANVNPSLRGMRKDGMFVTAAS